MIIIFFIIIILNSSKYLKIIYLKNRTKQFYKKLIEFFSIFQIIFKLTVIKNENNNNNF